MFKFHVFYVLDSSPRLLSFPTIEKRGMWLAKFLLEKSDGADAFVQMVFSGEIEHLHPDLME